MPKWALSIEDVRGVFVILVMRGRSLEGSGSADDLTTALSMGEELYLDCRRRWKEMPVCTAADR